MEHSRLLKFLVPGRHNTDNMADSPTFKIQYEYQGPNNVEAEVPGSQEIREANEISFGKSTEDIRQLDGAVKEYQNGGYTMTRTSYSEVRSEVVQGTRITRTTVTLSGEEASSDVVRNEEKDYVEERKSKTKIPKLKFRQAAEKVRSERRKIKEKEAESQLPKPKTSIPKLTRGSKIPPPTSKPYVVKREISTEVKALPDDEFEKIYEEIIDINETEVIDDNILNNKVEDPDKLESKFEEIIHDYEDNKIQPINVEKIRQSRIPSLKRKGVAVDASKSIQITTDINKVRTIPRLKEISMRVKADDEGLNQIVTRKYTKTISTEKVLPGDVNKSEDSNNELSKTSIKYISKGDASKINKYSKVITTEKTLSWKETENKVSKEDDKKSTSIYRSISVASSGSHNKDTFKDSGSKISAIHRSISLSSKDQSKLSTNIDDKVDNIAKVKSQTENIVKESIKIGIPVFESHVSKFENNNDENLRTVRLNKTINIIDDPKMNYKTIDTHENDNKYEVVTERKSYQINDQNPNVSGSITITRISTDLSDSGHSVEIKEIDDNMKSPVTVRHSESIIKQSPKIEGTINRYIIENVSENNTKHIDNIIYYDNKMIKNDTYSIKSPEVGKGDIKYLPEKTKDSRVDEEVDILKGKVGRLINKIDSMDSKTSSETSKKDLSDELPKKKSVLSKIAMFERQNIEEPMPKRKPRPEKLPKLILKDIQQEIRPHVHTPKIVEEVLKPGQSNSEFAIYESNIEVNSPHMALITDKNLDIEFGKNNVLKGPNSHAYNKSEDNELNLVEHTLNKSHRDLKYSVSERTIEPDSKISGLGFNNNFDVKGRIDLRKDMDKYECEVKNVSNGEEVQMKEQLKIEEQSFSPGQSNVEFGVYKSTGTIGVDLSHFGTTEKKTLIDQSHIRTESRFSDFYEHNIAEVKYSKQEEHKSDRAKTNLDYIVNESTVSNNSENVDITIKSSLDVGCNEATQFKHTFEQYSPDTSQLDTEELKNSPVRSKLNLNFDKNKDDIKPNVITDAPVILVSPKINMSKTIQRNYSSTNNEYNVGISKTSTVEINTFKQERSPIYKTFDGKFFGLKGDTYRLKDTSNIVGDKVTLPDNSRDSAIIYENIVNVDNDNKDQSRFEEISKSALITDNIKPKALEFERSENVMQYENINPDNEIIHAGFTKKHIQMYENIRNRDSTFKGEQKQLQYEEITKGIATVSDAVTGTINYETKLKENTVQYENTHPISDNIYAKKHFKIYENIEGLDSAFKSDQKQVKYEKNTKVTTSVSDTVKNTINFESKYKDNTIQYESKRPINENIRIDIINSESDSNNEDVFSNTNEISKINIKCKRSRYIDEENDVRRVKSLAELDLGDAVKGKVNSLIFRMKSVEKFDMEKKEINIKEMPRKMSVLEKIAMFERKITPVKMDSDVLTNGRSKTVVDGKNNNNKNKTFAEEEYAQKIAELSNAKIKYGNVANMPSMVLKNGAKMPLLAVGTAMLDPRLTPHIISTAIDLGYRAIDTGFIYGNERAVGEAVKAKIEDGTVRREELFIIAKLWSTFHRPDLVEKACRASLEVMGLDYFDLYLIHNPMSFKEDGDPIPKIATVIQYSDYDFMDAWYGMEKLVSKGLVKDIGVSNFNSIQIQKILDKGTVKPAVNQVECHPYLSQQRLDAFCTEHDIKLSCFGTLGSKGTPLEYKTGLNAVIDDPLVQVMASGLNVTAAQLLIRYQIECGHGVVVKSSSAAHLWDNLQALNFHLTPGQVDALHALNRNKRTFTFKGMGDTHKNYPFMAAF